MDIPQADLERITPAIEALQAAFRPLLDQLSEDIEPAVVFRAAEDEE